MRWLASGTVLVLLYPACTFGSLASYTVTLCNAGGAPTEQYAEAGVDAGIPDPCDVLNQSNPASCTPWQCDVATSTCVQKTRDDDHDGDPPVACGGGDCDDTDPELNSLHVSPGRPVGAFQGNGMTPPTLSSNGVTAVVADTSTACLVVGNAESWPQTPCVTSSIATDFAEPFGAADSTGAFAVTFATNYFQGGPTAGCAKYGLGVAYAAALPAPTPTIAYDCASCETGVALPALTLTGGGGGAVAYYATTATSTCSASAATPLEVVAVSALGGATEGFGASACAPPPATSLTTMASSVRPPAMSLLSPVLFVASPDGAAASLWALNSDAVPPTPATGSPWMLSKLAGARGASMATRANTDHTTRVAVVSEIGCSSQAIHVEVVDYDASAQPPTFTSVGDLEISPPSAGSQTAPSIAWSPVRNHWLVTWVVSTPEGALEVMARFFDDTLVPSALIAVPGQAFAAEALPNGHAVLVTPPPSGMTSETILDSQLRCP